MSDFQQQALQLAALQQTPAWLSHLRAQAANDWRHVTWPTRKTEHWKNTSLASLQKNIPQAWAAKATGLNIGAEFIAVDAIRLVFVNGVFDQANSSGISEELGAAEVVRFSQANDAQQQLIAQYLSKVVEGPQHLFATLNNAWLDDGVLVHVPRKQSLAKPIYVVQIATPEAQAVSVNQRLLVVL
ncbi:MAG TPA: Fe-S cluster assembly protein SufD, partial [Cellvibrio sp.]|nr:Fe-S cluster assembly protein SufD [Cellvibrio sp.]